MSIAPVNQGSARGVFERGAVDCEKCRALITVEKPASVAVEFSVPCPKCGHRGIYFKRMIMTHEVAERRRNPR